MSGLAPANAPSVASQVLLPESAPSVASQVLLPESAPSVADQVFNGTYTPPEQAPVDWDWRTPGDHVMDSVNSLGNAIGDLFDKDYGGVIDNLGQAATNALEAIDEAIFGY